MDRYRGRTGDGHNYSGQDRADAQYPRPQSQDQPTHRMLDLDAKWKREILKARQRRQESRLCVLLQDGL